MTTIIPKNIFQTHKSFKYIQTKPKLVNAMKSWTRFSNEFNYCFYDNKLCEQFMMQNFSGKIYDAYKKLPMGVMKADLWRYCIIYRYGGIYADIDTICNVNPNIFINNSYLTVAPELGTNYFCQWTFSAPQGSPILKYIIDLSVDRIINISEIKGEHIIHYLTGPSCFTDGIINYLKNNNLPVFNDTINYVKYPSTKLAVFNCVNFHNKFIKHLFADDNSDRWTKERYKILCK